ncbi:MAG: prepilin-type N-terminal cleavage/methylation domain-containing protein [Leptolyngbyaceae cyanobacterium]
MFTVFSTKLVRRLKPHGQSQGGFTLLELLVAILIGGIIVSSLLFLVVEMLTVNTREEKLTQTQQSMRRAIDYITRDLSESVFVYSDFTSSYNLMAQLDDEPAGATPVLAFWRLDPISDDNIDDLTTYCNNQTAGSTAKDECETLLVRQSTYTLVVYFLQNNAAGDIWEGPSRIIRYELPAYSSIATNALTPTAGYADPTDLVPGTTPPEFNSFANWRKAAGGASTSGNSNVLTDFVGTVTTANTTACPTLAATGVTYARTPTASDSFYVCVAQPDGVNSEDLNKSVIVYLQGDALSDSNVIDGFSNSSNLPKLESQVLIRGVIQNDPT